MSFHENLWVATAAAAPVIALAAVIVASDMFNGQRQLARTAFPAGHAEKVARLLNGQLWVVALTLALQVSMLLEALWCLAAGYDRWSIVAPVIAEPLGVVLLLASAIVTSRLRFLGLPAGEERE